MPLKRLLLLCIITLTIVSLSGSFKIGGLDFGEFEKGGGEKHKLEKFEEHGDKGEKGYRVFEEQEKGAKGFHDKERHRNYYGEEDRNKKHYKHNDGYFAEKHGGVKGAKGHQFEDHGHFAKGHKTKGRHNIHKLDEYKKNTEFYDEDHDEAHKEKHGGYELRKALRGGGYHKNGHKESGFFEDLFGKLNKFDKGSHHFQDAGYKKAAGEAEHYNKGAEFARRGENGEHKEFGFSEKH